MQKVLHRDNRKNAFWIASALIGLSICSYIYFVTATIRNIVTEKNLAVQISDMNQKISSKEFAFIDLQDRITMQYAESLGFTDPKQKVFISPKSVSYISSNVGSAI